MTRRGAVEMTPVSLSLNVIHLGGKGRLGNLDRPSLAPFPEVHM